MYIQRDRKQLRLSECQPTQSRLLSLHNSGLPTLTAGSVVHRASLYTGVSVCNASRWARATHLTSISRPERMRITHSPNALMVADHDSGSMYTSPPSMTLESRMPLVSMPNNVGAPNLAKTAPVRGVNVCVCCVCALARLCLPVSLSVCLSVVCLSLSLVSVSVSV